MFMYHDMQIMSSGQKNVFFLFCSVGRSLPVASAVRESLYTIQMFPQIPHSDGATNQIICLDSAHAALTKAECH